MHLGLYQHQFSKFPKYAIEEQVSGHCNWDETQVISVLSSIARLERRHELAVRRQRSHLLNSQE